MLRALPSWRNFGLDLGIIKTTVHELSPHDRAGYKTSIQPAACFNFAG